MKLTALIQTADVENALWFISLGLSLGCALIATLLEQWARDFLHRADMHSAPLIRARLFSYLYYGLKRFNMHTVVEIIPLLLHASLFLFFGGLIAFLFPINMGMATVVAAILAILTAVYFVLTVLPLIHLDCPYRTPLSSSFWFLLRWIGTQWPWRRPNWGPSSAETIVQVISRRAVGILPERNTRDYSALVWTVKSLADDAELEPLVEAIPDVLWSPNGRRHSYDCHIRNLVHHPDLKLPLRIENLLRSCDSGLLRPDARKRRQITGYRALWAILTLPCGPAPLDAPAGPLLDRLDLFGLQDYFEAKMLRNWRGLEKRHYLVSVQALLRWRMFQYITHDLALVLNYLARCQDGISHTIDLSDSISFLKPQADWFTSNGYDPILDGLMRSSPPRALIPNFIQAVHKLRADITPHRILFDDVWKSPAEAGPPYAYEETRAALHLDDSLPFWRFKFQLEWAMYKTIILHRHRWEDASPNDWVDISMRELCSWWIPNKPTPIPSALIYYINNRGGDISQLLSPLNKIHRSLWAAFPETLRRGTSLPPSLTAGKDVELTIGVDQLLAALWRVAFLQEVDATPALYESVLQPILDSAGSSHLKSSVATLVKRRILDALVHRALGTPHWLMPTTSLDILVQPTCEVPALTEWKHQVDEARVVLFAQFLEEFDTEVVPFKMVETIKRIGCIVPRGKVHRNHQIRLATGVQRVANLDERFMNAVINSELFDVYAGRRDKSDEEAWVFSGSLPVAWLDEPTARATIRGALGVFPDKFPSSDAALVCRMNLLLSGLDSLHVNA